VEARTSSALGDNTNLMLESSKSSAHILKSSTNISSLASGRNNLNQKTNQTPTKQKPTQGGSSLMQTMKAVPPIGDLTKRVNIDQSSSSKNKKKRRKSQTGLNGNHQHISSKKTIVPYPPHSS
jgi:hypothetical protein